MNISYDNCNIKFFQMASTCDGTRQWNGHQPERHRWMVPPMWLLGQLVKLKVPSAAPTAEFSLVWGTSEFDLHLFIPLTSGIYLPYEMNE